MRLEWPRSNVGIRRGRDARSWLLLLPFALAIGVISVVGWRTWETRQSQSAAYDLGVTALADGNLPFAIAQFGEAGGYRDAREQRVTSQQLLAPFQAAYLDAQAAIDQGDHKRAVELLRSVVAAMPENLDAAALLKTAEALVRTDLEREITLATTARDWLTVERATLNLAFLNGAAPDETALSELRLNHAPVLFTRNSALYQIGPDGGDHRLLFDQLPVASPLWSPDRSRIAFFSVVPGSEQFAALFLVDADGHNLRLVEAEAIYSLPAWSPDGTLIAFIGPASNDGTTVHVYELASETTREVPLPDGYLGATSPSWSSDGMRFVAIGLGSQGNNAILTVELESMEASTLLEATPANARAVAWSPVADMLLLWTTTGESDWYALRGSAIYLVRIDDLTIVPVTRPTQAPSRPVWSPDGSTFAYLERGGTLHLRVPTGIGERTMELPHKGNGMLSWSPGGEGLAIPPLDPVDPAMIVPVGDRLGPVQLLALRFEDGWPAADFLWSPNTAPDPALYDPFPKPEPN